jgi:molybdopterin-containing oxidoreductase family iron-sulfur binding subunit
VINAALGNVGATVRYTVEPDPERPSHVDALRRLAREAAAGEVDTLILLGGNPVYDAPADLGFRDVLSKIPHALHLASYVDETSAACRWHVPRSHWLETWGDARDYRGGWSITQPLIRPLYESRSDIELLAAMLGGAPASGHEIVRRTFAAAAGAGGGEAEWQRALHDGTVAGTEWPAADPPLASGGLEHSLAERLAQAAVAPASPYDVLFELDGKVLDGRFANNGWLQELPDALTKLTWDNAALIAPVTAKDLGIDQEEHLRITVGGASVELPVFIMPGMAQATVAVSLGYGRTAAGEVGNGRGVDVFPLRRSDGLGFAPAALERTGGRTMLATTQNHFAIDNEGAREIAQRAPVLVRELELAAFRASAAQRHGDAETERHESGHHAVQLWEPHDFPGHKWGMAIDLNACIGCNTCMVACQSENNIPVVGKRDVATGREMHWIRVDRYFAGDPADPVVSFQPVTCQHCDTAPCEQVCPVAATVHSHEGLNLMVYNRCVGTRYCSNNCPYKVRRFNYWNNHRNEQAPLTMIYNPDVTMRSRGVMEKCTFCIQRINAVKIRAKNDRRPIRDGEIVPACAQACPTRAIHFGDLNDETSEVAARHHDERAYALLEELNTRPANRYQARLRNTEGEPA